MREYYQINNLGITANSAFTSSAILPTVTNNAVFHKKIIFMSDKGYFYLYLDKW